ncbi:MAG TPA: hypothetical protein VG847_01450 [Chitinophagaceae bacterium]|nr:hypothetical protein [Chitinophagaceae bacterium]
MEAQVAQQEILLVTGTSFTSANFCETSDTVGYTDLSEKEKLEVACWNGLLPVMLPEIFRQFSKSRKLYLWEIREGRSFIELELGEKYMEFEKCFSLDPYMFLPLRILS